MHQPSLPSLVVPSVVDLFKSVVLWHWGNVNCIVTVSCKPRAEQVSKQVYCIVGVSRVFLLVSVYHQLILKELMEADWKVWVLGGFAFFILWFLNFG